MDSNPLILGLETATRGGSVCLARGTAMLASSMGDADVSHSNSLLRDIRDVLGQANVSLKDVDTFAVAIGPGSFTGLRIGLATIKALAATLLRSCVGIPTLQAIAHAAGPSERTVALLPAGRGEVFVQLFSVSADGEVRQLDDAAHLAPQQMFERYGSTKRIIWAGSGAHLHRDLIAVHAQDNGVPFVGGLTTNATERFWRMAPAEQNLAQHVALLGLQRYQAGQTVAPEFLSAVYVRPSDAELKANVVNN